MPASAKSLPLTHKRLLAYAHPLREEIFTILTTRMASPAELTRELGLGRRDLPNVTHHTKYLVENQIGNITGVSGPLAVAVGDLTGDKKADLVAAQDG